MRMKIDIFGAGYVGLTLSLTLAKCNHNVSCWDIDENKINQYKEYKSDIREPYIDDMLKEYQNSGNLKFQIYNNQKFVNTDLVIITIGTALKGESLTESNSNLFKLVGEIVDMRVKYIMLRSTVEIGTCRKLDNLFGKKSNFIFAPERTIEGKAIEELLSLPQIAACKNEESRSIVRNCFEPLGIEIMFSQIWEEAELAKLICNVYRDYNFSFSNLLLTITQEFGLDTSSIINLVSSKYDRMPLLKTGPVSGPCLSKDSIILSNSISNKTVKSVLHSTRRVNSEIINSARNDIEIIIEKFSFSRILFIGLTFKNTPFTTDTRDSHSIELINKLKNKYDFLIYDPYTDKNSRILFKNNFIDNLEAEDHPLVVFCNIQKWVVDLYLNRFEKSKTIKYWLYQPPFETNHLSYCLGDHKQLKLLKN